MDLRESAAEQEFRADLRAWLARHVPDDERTGVPSRGPWDRRFVREYTVALHRAGYAGLTWPVEYGGQDRAVAFEAIYLDESARAGASDHVGVIGLNTVGPTIAAFGTAEQKAHFLPRILTGEVVFCVGFSEAEAGSDLAALRTTAIRDGDEYVVSGRKLWSSYAHAADYCLLLASRGSAGDRHGGLVCLLVDLRAAGVERRPIRQATGDAQFGEIALTDTRIPMWNVLGGETDGWRVAMAALAHERSTLGFTLASRLETQFGRLVATARETGRAGDPVVRDQMAGLYAQVAGVRWTAYRVLGSLSRAGTPGPESSIIKLCWSQASQRLCALAVELLGTEAQMDGPDAFWHGYWQYHLFRSLGDTIGGGTSEILRSVIAERVLDLPKSR